MMSKTLVLTASVAVARSGQNAPEEWKPRKKKIACAATLTLACTAVPGFAADIPRTTQPPFVTPSVSAVVSPWDIAFGAAIMSDYVFRGITQSNHRPSGAAYFE